MNVHLRTDVLIPATVAEVWDRLAVVENHASWMSDASSIEFLSDTRSGIGTTIRVRTSVGPLRADDVMRFTRWEPPRSMTVEHVGRIGGTGEFRLEPAGDNTRLIWEENLLFPWYLGGPLTGVLARPILRRVFGANLGRFRDTFAP